MRFHLCWDYTHTQCWTRSSSSVVICTHRSYDKHIRPCMDQEGNISRKHHEVMETPVWDKFGENVYIVFRSTMHAKSSGDEMQCTGPLVKISKNPCYSVDITQCLDLLPDQKFRSQEWGRSHYYTPRDWLIRTYFLMPRHTDWFKEGHVIWAKLIRTVPEYFCWKEKY